MVSGPVDAAAASAERACALSDFNNDENTYYTSFACDDMKRAKSKSDATSAELYNIPTAFLSSSSSTDVLGLMHERTGHQNKRSLIECVKSRLVTGLQIEDKHIRKFKQDDRHLCDICARSKLTRTIFKKLHTVRGQALGDYISVDIAVFVNCPSREGYKYVACFTDHATKFSWVYPMRTRDEFIEKLRHLIDVELHSHGAKMKHYHADGGAELISKLVLTLLKREGSRYTWNPADTPELNATSERRFRTLGERCLSMLLRAGLPVDFWWDAYETSNYLTVRLPTKTAHGYMTPFEGVYGEVPDLSHLRIWGCKAYLKVPKNYQRKDWRDKSFAGYFVGYSEPGEMGYRLYIPDLRDTVVGVNVTFNEVVPSYAEEYYNELDKMKFEVAPDESTAESFSHLVGEKYFDDDTLLEFVTTRVVEYMTHIVAFRAPVLADEKIGREEKSPIHVADVVRMMNASSGLGSKSNRRDDLATELSARLGVKSVQGTLPVESSSRPGVGYGRRDEPVTVGVKTAEPKALAPRNGQARVVESSARSKRVRFDLREFGDGPNSQSEMAEADVRSHEGHRSSDERRHENRSVGRPSDAATIPSRTVMRYQEGNSPRPSTGRHVSLNSRLSPERTEAAPANIGRTSASSDEGTDVFVSHKWGRAPETDKPIDDNLDKRVRTKRALVNITSLGNSYAASDGDDDDNEEPDLATESDHEAAPESYNEAARDERWVQSMKDEIKALRNRGVWRVIPTPKGVRLIKSKYVYRVKKDWTGKVVKRKSRLVVQGFSQREGIDYDETFAPVAKVTTFRLMLALAKVLELEIHQLDVDSAFLYADLDEDVYVKPPPGMDVKQGYCLKLLKSLYGLKQAPRNWNKNIVDYIK